MRALADRAVNTASEIAELFLNFCRSIWPGMAVVMIPEVDKTRLR
jgi:hypothetical protein